MGELLFKQPLNNLTWQRWSITSPLQTSHTSELSFLRQEYVQAIIWQDHHLNVTKGQPNNAICRDIYPKYCVRTFARISIQNIVSKHLPAYLSQILYPTICQDIYPKYCVQTSTRIFIPNIMSKHFITYLSQILCPNIFQDIYPKYCVQTFARIFIQNIVSKH